eukprot:Nk52_evm1s2015 gene=Nk52_evmTU1s2015
MGKSLIFDSDGFQIVQKKTKQRVPNNKKNKDKNGSPAFGLHGTAEDQLGSASCVVTPSNGDAKQKERKDGRGEATRREEEEKDIERIRKEIVDMSEVIGDGEGGCGVKGSGLGCLFVEELWGRVCEWLGECCCEGEGNQKKKEGGEEEEEGRDLGKYDSVLNGVDVICYGLGKLSQSKTAKVQCAVLLALIDKLPQRYTDKESPSSTRSCSSSSSSTGVSWESELHSPLQSTPNRVLCYDPVMNHIEREIISRLGMTWIPENEMCARVCTHSANTAPLYRRTVYYMPHCDGVLYENVVQANHRHSIGEKEEEGMSSYPRCSALRNICIIGNSFSNYELRWVESKLREQIPLIYDHLLGLQAQKKEEEAEEGESKRGKTKQKGRKKKATLPSTCSSFLPLRLKESKLCNFEDVSSTSGVEESPSSGYIPIKMPLPDWRRNEVFNDTAVHVFECER